MAERNDPTHSAAGGRCIFPPQRPAPRVCCTKSAEAERKDTVVRGTGKDVRRTRASQNPRRSSSSPPGPMLLSLPRNHPALQGRITHLLPSFGARFLFLKNPTTTNACHLHPTVEHPPVGVSTEAPLGGYEGGSVATAEGSSPREGCAAMRPREDQGRIHCAGLEQQTEKLTDYVTNGEMSSCVKSIY